MYCLCVMLMLDARLLNFKELLVLLQDSMVNGSSAPPPHQPAHLRMRRDALRLTRSPRLLAVAPAPLAALRLRMADRK